MLHLRSVQGTIRTWTRDGWRRCIASTPQGLQGSRPPAKKMTCRGRPVLMTPNILTSFFLFFPFSGTSEYRKSLSFSYAPYHTILRWKIYKFSGKGHSPSADLTPSPLAAPRFSRLRRSTCDPPVFQWHWRLCGGAGIRCSPAHRRYPSVAGCLLNRSKVRCEWCAHEWNRWFEVTIPPGVRQAAPVSDGSAADTQTEVHSPCKPSSNQVAAAAASKAPSPPPPATAARAETLALNFWFPPIYSNNRT